MILSIRLFALWPGSGGVRVGHILACPRYAWVFTMTSLKRASRSGQKPGQVTAVPLPTISLRRQHRFWKMPLTHPSRSRKFWRIKNQCLWAGASCFVASLGSEAASNNWRLGVLLPAAHSS